MPLLNHQLMSVYEVDYKEFERFVGECYPWLVDDYSFIAYEESGNDSYFLFNPDGAPLSKYDEGSWNMAQNEDDYSQLNNGIVFDKLCFDGFITPWSYLVRVSW